MGSFSRSLANILFGWVSGVISKVWAMINTDSGTALVPWVGKKWLLIVAVLCLLGLVADLVVYAIRWRPHKVWISAFNRIRNKLHPEEKLTDNRQKTAGTSYGYPKQPYETQAAESQPNGTRLANEGYPKEEETIRYVPERMQMDPPNPVEPAYAKEYERIYARPSEERFTQNEDARNTAKPAGYVAPRRKHVSFSDLNSEDEGTETEYRRKRRTVARIDPAEAYNAPVYPPQWNMKSNTGENTDHE